MSDVVYSDLQLLGNTPSPSIFQCSEANEVAVELGGWKAYSMTGYRISWFATRNVEIAAFWKRYKSNRDKGTPIPVQRAALKALTDSTAVTQMQKNLLEYRERAMLLKQGFTQFGLTVAGLQHTPFAWIKVTQGETSEGFAERILHQASVLVIPGSYFSPAGEGCFRASIFQPKEKLRKALEKIENVL